MKIEIISGSARKDSVTVRVAFGLQKWLKENSEHEVGVLDCREFRLPELQEVFNSVDNTPDEYKPIARRIFESEGLILVTPEYNGSFSPAMKNLLDHFPKQQHKPIGIVTASNGGMGGMRAAQQLILLSAALFAIPSPYLLLVPGVENKFDEAGNLTDEKFYRNMHNFVTEYLWLAEKLNAKDSAGD